MSAGALSAQIQPFQTINPVCFLVINPSAFPTQLDMNTRATVPYPGFRYFPYTQGFRPIVTPALPLVDSSALHQQPASTADTDTVGFHQKLHRLALLSRPQNFCFSTACSISLPRLRSATSLVSSAADFHPPTVADAAILSHLDRQISSSSYKRVASKIPIFLQTSPTRVPVSACFSANEICSSV